MPFMPEGPAHRRFLSKMCGICEQKPYKNFNKEQALCRGVLERSG